MTNYKHQIYKQIPLTKILKFQVFIRRKFSIQYAIKRHYLGATEKVRIFDKNEQTANSLEIPA